MYYNYADLNYINQELRGVWPDWTAVKLLGRGSYGAVYEIRRYIRSNLEIAAMKVLRVPENEMEIMQLRAQGVSRVSTETYYEKFVDSIQNEIIIMQKLVGNSHLVSYEDYSIRKRNGEIGWDIYIRMELLTGLTDYIENNPITEQTTLKLGLDISQGLMDCHQKGILHRDIKPQNIFVNDTGNFKLGDFGISRAAPGSQDLLSFKGTLAYMAPEVYRMLSTDARSDIYSLGVVLYQCLNDNRLPFVPKHFTPEDIEAGRQRRLAGEPIPDPEHGSYGFKNIVLKAMAEKPQDRYQSAAEMYRALAEIYMDEYVNGNKISAEEREAPPAAPETVLLSDKEEKKREEKKAEVVKEPKEDRRVAPNAIEQPVSRAAEPHVNRAEVPHVNRSSEGPGRRARSQSNDYAIVWNDPVLEKKIRKITGIHSGAIMQNDVRELTNLNLSNSQYANNNMKIADISALRYFTKLEYLFLDNNRITDISVVRYLPNLIGLSFVNNNVRDISALSGLKNLNALQLKNNPIKDYSPIQHLNKMFDSGYQEKGPSAASAKESSATGAFVKDASYVPITTSNYLKRLVRDASRSLYSCCVVLYCAMLWQQKGDFILTLLPLLLVVPISIPKIPYISAILFAIASMYVSFFPIYGMEYLVATNEIPRSTYQSLFNYIMIFTGISFLLNACFSYRWLNEMEAERLEKKNKKNQK